MPIKGLSEQRRVPRIGKIHLGIKKKKGDVEYPSATDYFVCPPEVQAVFGEQPKELAVMIPVEDEEYWASQYYRAYSRTRGLVCKGDGEDCNRMIDIDTGEMANRDTLNVVWKPAKCEGRECPYYKNKQCREVMNLQFLLPSVPGLGVWQIDTSSINSIRNINSGAELIRGICGRLKMIPLLLTLEKQEVVNPDDGKKKNVCVLNLRHGKSLQNLLADSVKPIQELLAPAPVEDEAPRDVVPEEPDIKQAQRDADELFPPDPKHTSEAAVKLEPASAPKPFSTSEETKKSLIDLEWLEESLKALQAKGIKAYSDESLLSYMKMVYKMEGEDVYRIASTLDKGKATHFTKVIQDALDKP